MRSASRCRLPAFGRGQREVAAVPAIFVASGAEATVYLGFGAFLGFLPLYGPAVGLNDAEVALVGAAMGVFGTVWDVGEALGPILAGILIARYGFAAGFDVIAAITAATAIGLAILVVDPVRKRTGRD